ncbi:RidA family protein [uncultured Croceitalea sp.]|uniref:RidA family protein n=1 Tax=uncultured Croceitalea sp. TaxID=1798908 RepID=UPI0033064122
MKSKTIANKAKPLGNYPHIKRVGDFIFVSGTSSRKVDNTHIGAMQKKDGSWDLDIKLQTEAVIKNIEALIQNMDATLNDVVDITTFLVDMKDFKGYNEVYGQFFDNSGPTRTTVAVHQLPHPNLLIEIKAMVYKPLE